MASLLFVFFAVMLLVGGLLTIFDAVTEEEYSRAQRVAYVGLGVAMFIAVVGLLATFVSKCFV